MDDRPTEQSSLLSLWDQIKPNLSANDLGIQSQAMWTVLRNVSAVTRSLLQPEANAPRCHTTFPWEVAFWTRADHWDWECGAHPNCPLTRR